MRNTKRISALCASVLLSLTMVFTSAGVGINGVYGYQDVLANEVAEQDITEFNGINAEGGLKEFTQKTEIVDDIQLEDEGIQRERITSLYSENSEWTNYSSDYYYNMLSSDEKVLYERLQVASLKFMESTEDVTNIKFGNEYYIDNVDCSDLNMSKDRVQFVVELFYQTESQYFFLQNMWTISKTTDGKVVAASIGVYDEFVDGATRMEYATQFKNAINDWVAKAQQEADTYGKQKVIHDLICENVVYQSGNYDQSAASALLNYGVFQRRTVCAGYAKAFQILCNAMDIDTIITVSTSHAWNTVNIDGYWYIVDCTYDKSFYSFGEAPYLDISSDTLKSVSDNDEAHVVRSDWEAYQPFCLYDYGKDKNDIVWNIGRNVTATLDGSGTLTIKGTGATYDYRQGESPIVNSRYNYAIKSVIVNSGVTKLGDYLFENGSFETIQLPDTLTSWSANSFSKCTNVSKIINNSGLSSDLSIFENGEKVYVWVNSNTGEIVTELPKNTTVIKQDYVPVSSIELSTQDAIMNIGDTLQLTANVYPDNASQKTVKWTSSDTAIADVDNNGLVTAYTDGAVQITAQAGGATAICNITVKVTDQSLYEIKQASNGNWYLYISGGIDYDYNGIAQNEFGWWKITNGQVDFGFTGLAQNEYGWWKITGGAVDFNFTGLAQNEVGWWKITGGAVDFNFTGLAQNEVGWWKITGGMVDFGFTGLANNEVGWWKITNGMVDFGFTGLANNEFGWWKITGGMVDFGFTGLAQNEVGWWKVTNGAVDFGYNGLAENEYGLWKISNGMVDFGFNGQVECEGIMYNIVNGHAV